MTTTPSGGPAERTIVLVGATSGIGRHAARRLAAEGHRLVLIGRDPERVRRLARDLPAAHVITADISTADGVDQAAKEVHAAVGHIDTLVNNAGVMLPDRRTTAEGIELNLAVHHLAPWSMTGRLLPLLRRGDGRVVNVNSEGHRAPLRGPGPVLLDLGDLNSEHGYDPFLTYSRTKLANLMFTYELHRRHPELTVVAVHPGMVRTDLGRHFSRVLVTLVGAFSLPARQGAEPIVRLATAPEVAAGAYYDRFTPVASSHASYDLDTARRLWDATAALRGPFAPAA
ncbi:NAD(P)-dependent dehydrogenase (short-subunit alcohol dehydrogenase family) [Thermocatellispora tengchongensis]|uniref:NAD(P)-dependent dehydrogenase (Short-subunit alcohol dehydrogenase family) n=1 Tax=Thermocatellispora tengchongensis TaxID=1073253 RepID=A0A840P5D7_9ACTN|nr:SDR family NAD(P)-dependent oxidoreductase [Thermocatellispora tengchongensis]MBB5133081.1 NAD(P)-dependent dehydrogenase (short-subunit alcohol dehydrogenase family) [Thermocatellispora tengchongensis]